MNGFPTLNIYKDGAKVAEFKGERDVKGLKAYVEKVVKGEIVSEKKKDEL